MCANMGLLGRNLQAAPAVACRPKMLKMCWGIAGAFLGFFWGGLFWGHKKPGLLRVLYEYIANLGEFYTSLVDNGLICARRSL